MVFRVQGKGHSGSCERSAQTPRLEGFFSALLPPHMLFHQSVPRKTLGLRNIKAPIFGSRKPKSGLPPIFWLKSRELRLLGV